MRMPVFAGDRACEVELCQKNVSCLATMMLIMRCVKSFISVAHCPFQWNWQVLHNYDMSVLQRVSMFFGGIACLIKVRPLFMREFPHTLMTWHTAGARISVVKSLIDVNKQICIDLRALKRVPASWWIGSTIPWKHFKICSARLFSAAGFWLGSCCMPFSALGWLAPASACEAQGEPVTSRLPQHARD